MNTQSTSILLYMSYSAVFLKESSNRTEIISSYLPAWKEDKQLQKQTSLISCTPKMVQVIALGVLLFPKLDYEKEPETYLLCINLQSSFLCMPQLQVHGKTKPLAHGLLTYTGSAEVPTQDIRGDNVYN